MLNFKEQNDKYLSCIEQYLDEQCFQYDSQPQKVLFDARTAVASP